MRSIDLIVVHCTGGPATQTAEDIVRYHTKTLGWKHPGYHYIVEASGRMSCPIGIEKVANGVRGHNAHSIHVCYVGGLANGNYVDTRTFDQKYVLRLILRTLKRDFPNAQIVGHRDLAAKACPCFDARAEYANL